MVIQIDDVGTVNKGAELMLFAILQEIERVHPDATVIYNDASFLASNHQASYFKTNLKIIKPYYMRPRFSGFLKKSHAFGIAERINANWNITQFLWNLHHEKADILLNAAGFKYSDQFNLTNKDIKFLKKYLSNYSKSGTKIVFLPQAFGPITQSGTKSCINVLFEHADMIFARERDSYNYMSNFGISAPPLYLAPDFTSIVKGCCPEQLKGVKDSVCIIPNMQMVRKGATSFREYLVFWEHIVRILKEQKIPMFILNHEGVGDESLIDTICEKTGVKKVTGLNAIETKGVIAQSLFVISSRFHGVANALSSAVPCLATSWSHKYQLLFEEYGMKNCVLDISDLKSVESKIIFLIDKKNNSIIRNNLSCLKHDVDNRCRKMWELIWN